jgi:hypothetical protein
MNMPTESAAVATGCMNWKMTPLHQPASECPQISVD